MVEETLVLLNAAAGRGRAGVKHAVVRQMARAAGVPVAETASPEDLERQAWEAAAAGCRRVVAVGGDGTVNRVLNGIVGTAAALGVIPCGNGNDIARNLGIPSDVQAATHVSFFGPLRTVDVGLLRSAAPGSAKRYYAGIASFGFDSLANRIANEHNGIWRGRALYVYAMLRSLVEFRPPDVTITHDGGEYRGRIMLAVAANAPSYGGGMKIAPRAEMADGLLDLCIVRRMSRLKLLWCFPEVFSGAHLAREEVSYIRSARARITAERPLDVFADGEFVGCTPVEVEVASGMLQVIAPEAQ